MSFEGDDTTGLSGNDKEILARTLGIVMEDRRKNGEKLFLTFFGKYPQHMQYFKDFKDKTVDELPGNRKLIAHGSYVLGSFDSIAKNLDDPEVLVELLLKIGYSHGKSHVHTSALPDLKVAILDAFTEILGDEMTAEVAEVWDRALDVILNTVGSGIQSYDQNL